MKTQLPQLKKVDDSPVDVYEGGQYGDEGKGKVTDEFAGNYDLCIRPQGGPNAGHTLCIDGKKHVFSQYPCGAFHEGMGLGIGCGSAVNPNQLIKEYKYLLDLGNDVQKRTYLSNVSPIITPYHRLIDAAEEESRKEKGEEIIGSTKQGISPVYQDVAGRRQLTMGHLMQSDWEDIFNAKTEFWQRELHKLGYSWDHTKSDLDIKEWKDAVQQIRSIFHSQVVVMPYFLNKQMKNGKRIAAECAQGTHLDVTHGEQPFVTSSHSIVGGVCTGLGIPPSAIGNVILVIKGYSTRVGSGSHPSELTGETRDLLAKNGDEFGAVTRRPRRTGWLDLVAVNYSVILNGPTHVYMAKGDCLDGFPEVGLVKRYEGYEEDLHDVDTFGGKVGIPELMPGWNNLHGVTDVHDLPSNFVDFCLEVNRNLNLMKPGLQINFVGTGQGRGECVAL